MTRPKSNRRAIATADEPSAATTDPMAIPPPITRDGDGQTYDEWAQALRRAGRDAIRWTTDRRAVQPPVPRYTSGGGDVHPMHPGDGDGDHKTATREFAARLCQALASTSRDFTSEIVHRLMNGPGLKDASAETRAKAINAGLAFIAAQNPVNELETLTLLSIWHTQKVASSQLWRLEACETREGLEAHGAMAVRIGNVAVRQLEALAKLRGGGKQQVEVRHVYVNGNAVIGDIHAAGGGGDGGSGRQSHDALGLAFAPGLALSGPDSARDAVPATPDQRQAPVQMARGARRSAARSPQRAVQNRSSDD